MTIPIRPQGPHFDGRSLLHRILTPDEFHQARQLDGEALRSNPFPVVPLAPKDAIRTGDPNATPDQGKKMTGLGRILTQYVAEPIMEHPLTGAATVLVPGAGLVMAGLMGKDIVEYAAQKWHESQMSPEDRAKAEADPKRIPGERAAVEAVMLAAAPLIHAAMKSTDVTGGMVEAGAGAVGEMGGVPKGGAPAGKAPLDLKVAEAGGTERFSGLPVTAEMRGAIKGHVDKIVDSWKQIFTPATRGPQAREAASILRATTGEAAAAYERAAFQLDEFRRAIDPLPDSDKLGFIDAIENGKSQPTPEFQAAADVMRSTLDDARKEIQALGTGKLEHFIEDYFPHIWEDPQRAALAFKQGNTPLEQTKIATGGKAPFEGSKSFLKQRSIPTTLEGIQLGLKPVSMNPVDLTLLKLREMQRYLTAHRSLNEMKEAGLVQFVRAGEMRPDGYAKIDDKVATVFGPRTGAVTLPEGAAKGVGSISKELQFTPAVQVGKRTFTGAVHILARDAARDAGALSRTDPGGAVDGYVDQRGKFFTRKQASKAMGVDEFDAVDMPAAARGRIEAGEIGGGQPMAPEDVGVMGMRIMGEYWAPEAVSRVVNNYLSPGLRGNAIFDAYRGLGNTLNQAQLGLSAFHLGFTSFDASVSRASLGIEYMASGNPLQGVKELMSTPAAPITNALLGRKIRAAYLDPASASPEMQALANAVKEAGGRVKQDSFYQNSAPERMFAALRAGEYGKATGLSLPAIAEWTTGWLMNHVVPMQKLGVFGDLAKKVLADLPPEATLVERRQALQGAWDSVDNRMGQLVYDNLFWNKTMKDLSMASVRSVGWNLGTIREIGGGGLDLAEAANKLVTGKASEAELTHKAAYVIALPITVGLYGAAYQYLRTGSGPQEPKDMFFPRTGEVDQDGNPERVQLPSYMKDVFAYAGDPWQTVKHKVSPLSAALVEMLNNQDFYGDEIRNPNDPLVVQAKQEAEYMIKEFVPFGIRNMMEQSKRGDQTKTTKIGNLFGITPAPRRKVWSEAQNLMSDYLRAGAPTGSTPEQVEHRNARAELLREMRASGGDISKVEEAVASSGLTDPEIAKLMKRAHMTPAEEKFKRLTAAQAVEVYRKSTGHQRELFYDLLVKKIARSENLAALRSTP